MSAELGIAVRHLPLKLSFEEKQEALKALYAYYRDQKRRLAESGELTEQADDAVRAVCMELAAMLSRNPGVIRALVQGIEQTLNAPRLGDIIH